MKGMFCSGLVLAAAISTPAFADVLIADFDSVNQWALGGSRGAESSVSVVTDSPNQGTGYAQINASHSTATSFDYVDFYRDNFGSSGIDLSDLKNGGTISFWFMSPVNTLNAQHPIDLRIHSDSGHIEVGISNDLRDGKWHQISLAWSNFAEFNSFDPSAVKVIQFRSYGDASDQDYTNVFALDDLKVVSAPVPEPATLGMLTLAAGALLARRRR